MWMLFLGNFNTCMTDYPHKLSANISHSIHYIESKRSTIITDSVTIWKGPFQLQSCSGLSIERKPIWYESNGGWEWQSAWERIDCHDVTSPVALSIFVPHASERQTDQVWYAAGETKRSCANRTCGLQTTGSVIHMCKIYRTKLIN